MLWFDTEHAYAAAGVVLLTPDRRAILQLRDDIEGIDNPGRITPFGGAAEPGETPVACALRELEEETSIRASADALSFVAAVSKPDYFERQTACVFYRLENVDPESLNVTEGEAIVLSLDEVASDPRPTPFCKELCARIASTPLGSSSPKAS